MSPPLVVYRIDANDAIVYVNDEWDRFAADNGANAVVSARVVSRPLWDFVKDETTRAIYHTMIARARVGQVVRVPIRCDSPDKRRQLELTVLPLGDGAVEFRVRTISIEPRPAQALLDPAASRSDGLLRACGWCKKFDANGEWVEVEEAVKRLELFNAASLPLVTHGICPACEAAASAALPPLA